MLDFTSGLIDTTFKPKTITRFVDNRNIVCSSDAKGIDVLEKWNVYTGKRVYRTEFSEYIDKGIIHKTQQKCSLSVDRKYLLRIGLTGEVSVWDTATGAYLDRRKVEDFAYDAVTMGNQIVIQNLTDIYLFANIHKNVKHILSGRSCAENSFLQAIGNGIVWKEHTGLIYYDLQTKEERRVAHWDYWGGSIEHTDWESWFEEEVCCLNVSSDVSAQ